MTLLHTPLLIADEAEVGVAKGEGLEESSVFDSERGVEI